jgi:hypothetical protein
MSGWIVPPPGLPVKTEADLRREREAKITQLARRGLLRSERLRTAMLAVPREDFIPAPYRDHAYDEIPLPLPGERATISCPHSYPLFYEPLGLDAGHRFLEIGVGSGYGKALAREVVAPRGMVVAIDGPGPADRAAYDLSVHLVALQRLFEPLRAVAQLAPDDHGHQRREQPAHSFSAASHRAGPADTRRPVRAPPKRAAHLPSVDERDARPDAAGRTRSTRPPPCRRARCHPASASQPGGDRPNPDPSNAQARSRSAGGPHRPRSRTPPWRSA